MVGRKSGKSAQARDRRHGLHMQAVVALCSRRAGSFRSIRLDHSAAGRHDNSAPFRRTMRTINPFAVAVTLAFMAGTASSQAINLDIGVNGAHPAPSNSYGAAAGQAGTWNGVAGSVAAAGAVALVDTSGAATSVTLSVLGGVQDFEMDNPNTTGDDDSCLRRSLGRSADRCRIRRSRQSEARGSAGDQIDSVRGRS